ncbi:hypothetical protein ABGB07_34255 [Micromonosporaceae bacterium B7E4]
MRAEAEQVEAVARLWDAHLQADFPGHMRGADPLGIDMVLLDATIAGCVSSWLHDRGSLDHGRRVILARCLAGLDRVLPILSGQQEHAYYDRLRAMTVATLGIP